MHASDANAQPSQTDTGRARTVSDDDFAELEVVRNSLLHAQRHNTTAGLGYLAQRLGHILLRIDGVKE